MDESTSDDSLFSNPEDEYIPPAKVASIFKRNYKSRQSTSKDNASIIGVSQSTSNEDNNSTADQTVQKKSNPLWNYFTKNNDNAKCNICNANLKQGKTGTTSSLLKHLKKHKPVYLKYSSEKEVLIKELNEYKERQVPKKATCLDKTQTKITNQLEKVKWSTESTEHKQINKLVAQFVVSGMHPYYIVEEKGFKNLISKGFPRYTLPSRTTFSRKIIPQMFIEEKNKLQAILDADKPFIHSYSITTDGWKSQAGDGFWSITLHYVNGQMQIVTKALACSEISSRNTAEVLSNFLVDEVTKWNLDKTKRIYCVTDGGANIVAAARMSPFLHRQCFAHKLQLCIEAGLTDDGVKGTLKNARTLVGHYHKSTAATARMKHEQTKQGTQNPKNVIQMNDTRWNSEYLMLQRLIELKTAIIAELANSNNFCHLGVEEWNIAEALLICLKPFYTVTTVMCASEYPTTSMLIPVLYEIENKLEGIGKQNTSNRSRAAMNDVPSVTYHVQNISKTLLLALRSKFPTYKDDSVAQLATVLDPRFKCVLLEKTLMEKKLLDEMKLKNNGNSQYPIIEHPAQPCSPTEKETDDLWAALNKAAQEKESHSRYNPYTAEISAYLQEPRTSPNTNPFDWWMLNQQKYPCLAKVAAEYLAIPATQASSERLFSAAGTIVTVKRERLTPQHVEELVFLQDAFKN